MTRLRVTDLIFVDLEFRNCISYDEGPIPTLISEIVVLRLILS